MATGGVLGADEIRQFNGGLFADTSPPPHPVTGLFVRSTPPAPVRLETGHLCLKFLDMHGDLRLTIRRGSGCCQ